MDSYAFFSYTILMMSIPQPPHYIEWLLSFDNLKHWWSIHIYTYTYIYMDTFARLAHLMYDQIPLLKPSLSSSSSWKRDSFLVSFKKSIIPRALWNRMILFTNTMYIPSVCTSFHYYYFILFYFPKNLTQYVLRFKYLQFCNLTSFWMPTMFFSFFFIFIFSLYMHACKRSKYLKSRDVTI